MIFTPVRINKPLSKTIQVSKREKKNEHNSDIQKSFRISNGIVNTKAAAQERISISCKQYQTTWQIAAQLSNKDNQREMLL